MSEYSSLISTDVEKAAQVLRDGGLVAFATETVYGLGANALNVDAVARVFEAKNRPHFDPLIVHVSDITNVAELVTAIPEAGRQLANAFWPGPLTLVLPKRDIVPDLVTSGLPTVAVRVPSHPMAQLLLRKARVPVAAPSANPFGRLSPTCAEHVAMSLGDRVDLILDGGSTTVGVESTVVDVTGEAPVLLRHGGVTQEQIEEVAGPIQAPRAANDATPSSPGQLSQHYAPGTPLRLASDVSLNQLHGLQVGVLALTAQAIDDSLPGIPPATKEVLTTDGDLTRAAAQFFAALRRLDTVNLDMIIAVPFPETGLGRALNDRLRRACHS